MSARRRPADRADVSGKRRQVRRAGAAVFCPRRTRRVASRLRCFGASVCPLSCEYFGIHLSCIKQGVSHQSRCAVQQGAGELPASAARAEAAFFDSPTNQLVCGRCDRARSMSRPHAPWGERFSRRTRAALQGAALHGRRVTCRALRVRWPGRRGGSRCRMHWMERTPMQPPGAESAFQIRNISRPSIRVTRTTPRVGETLRV